MCFLRNFVFKFILVGIFYLNSGFLYSLDFLVSIPPQKFILKALVQNKHKIFCLYDFHKNLHNMKISPYSLSQFKNLKTYFIIDHPSFSFEKNIAAFFQMKSVDIFSIQRKLFKEKFLDYPKEYYLKDAHIWLSLIKVKDFFLNLYDYLITIDSKNKKFYKNNLNKYLKKIDELDVYIKDKFKNIKKRTYLSYHSSLFYYNKKYGLNDFVIEENGRKPSAYKMFRLTNQIDAYNLKFILIEENDLHNDPLNRFLEKKEIKKIYWNPLKENILKNLKELTDVLYKNLN